MLKIRNSQTRPLLVPEPPTPNPEPHRRRLTPATLRALYAEWRKLSPSITIEPPADYPPREQERYVRLAWSARMLKAPVASWRVLTEGQAKFLVKKMREESGDGPAYRAQLIAKRAVGLRGPGWDEFLAARLWQRFGVHRAQDLTPRQARAMIEELNSRIERQELSVVSDQPSVKEEKNGSGTGEAI